MKKYFIFCFIFLLAQNSFAGRPLFTDDAATVLPGRLEVELGTEFDKISSHENNFSISAVFTTGILQNLDLGIELPYFWLDPEEGKNNNGFGDLKVISKFNFLKEASSFPAMALAAGIKTETGDKDKGLGTDEVDVIANLIASKNLDPFALHFNAGYNFTGDPSHEEAFDFVNLSLAGEYACSSNLTLVSEIFIDIATENIKGKDPVEILVGATYTFPCNITLDSAIVIGLNNSASDYKFILGGTYEF